MASLAGRSLVSSYKELLKLNNSTPNSGVSASLQTVEDGFAGATALQLSNAGIASTGTLAVAGDLSVNTNKFNVAAASGNTSIAGSLAAVGDLAVNTNKFNVTAASGNTAVAGTLAVTGGSTLNALSATTGSFSSTLSATGNLAVNANKFTVTADSGDTAVAGTLSAVGDFAINTNKFAVTAASGNVSSAGTLSVTGNLNVNTNKFSVLASTGNTSISGTLTVADTVDFASTGAMRIPRGTAGQRPAGDTGMLRFNTNTQSFEGHNGVAWGAIGGSGGVGTSQYVRQTFVATAGQTSFTVTGGYTPDSVDVFQNGVKLVNGSGNDVTITSGTAVVLATGAAAGDVIDVIGLASGNFAGPATAKRQNFTATAGQTVFTVTGGYTPNQLDVFQNGTKLVTSVDVDVSNGGTFTLTTPAVVGDSLEVVGFTAANTIAGTLKFQAGTAAAPSITRFEDENTGIFFPAADTIAFSEGGVEAMRINSSGNVGIGTTTPDDKLDVNGFAILGTDIGTGQTSTKFHKFKGTAVQSTASWFGSYGGLLLDAEESFTAGARKFLITNSLTGNKFAIIRSTNATTDPSLGNSGAIASGTADFVITNTGDIGIGTTSPTIIASSSKVLDIVGDLSGAVRFERTSSTNPTYGYVGVTNGALELNAQSNSPIIFSTNGGSRVRINPTGEVGVGVTPSAWGASEYKAIQVGIGGSISGRVSTGDQDKVNVAANVYHDGTNFKYIATDEASIYQQTGGTHIFSSAPSGTAGSTATFTERLRIDSSGNVGIGTTSPTKKLHVVGPAANGAGNEAILIDANAVQLAVRRESSGGGTLEVGTPNNHNLGIFTNGTVGAYFASGGNIGIGTTTPAYRLNVQSVGAPALNKDIVVRTGDETNFHRQSLVYNGSGSAIGPFPAYAGGLYREHGGGFGISGGLVIATNNANAGPIILATADTERLRILSNGNVLIGATDTNITGGTVGFKFICDTTAPYVGIVTDFSTNTSNYHLYNKNATNNGYRFYVNLNGGITNFSANNTNLSDERLKTNISPAGNYLDKICSIPVKTFNYKDQGEDTEKTIGIIAQDVEAVIPELINNDGFGETPADGVPLKTIYQTDLQYALMKCIQELKLENDTLKSRIEALEAA